MAEKAFSFRAADRRRGRPRHAAVIVVAAGVALVATACTAASSGLVAAGPASTSPAVMVLKQGAGNGNGDIFIAPEGGGPEIIGSTGKVIWFHPLLPGEVATGFRTQTCQGKPVLTWWQGTGFGGLSSGTGYVCNDRYQQIAEVNAGNGYSADGHEFLITPWNTAQILACTTATANVTSIGGPAGQAVIGGVVQEIDISTGKVLFQWNNADHPQRRLARRLGRPALHLGVQPVRAAAVQRRAPGRPRLLPRLPPAVASGRLGSRPRTPAGNGTGARHGEEIYMINSPGGEEGNPCLPASSCSGATTSSLEAAGHRFPGGISRETPRPARRIRPASRRPPGAWVMARPEQHLTGGKP